MRLDPALFDVATHTIPEELATVADLMAAYADAVITGRACARAVDDLRELTAR